MDPVLHEKATDGTWHAYDYRDNTWGPTYRTYNSVNSGYTGPRVKDTRGGPMTYGGGVVNQDIVLINAVEEIQRNLNAFAILAENKHVDIAIADNTIKIYINILLNI